MAWNIYWHNETSPGCQLVARYACLIECRQLGRDWRAFHGRDAQTAQSSGLHKRQQWSQVVADHVDVPAEEIGDCLLSSFIRHMNDSRAGHRFKQFHCEMWARTNPGTSIRQLPGVDSRVFD